MRFARFGVVGASGLVVNELALALLVSTLGLDYLAAAVVATQVSTLWNFVLVELWAFRSVDARRSPTHRLLLFLLVNNTALLLRGPILVGLTSGLGINYLVSNLVSLAVLSVVRFAVADNWIWAVRSLAEEAVAASSKRATPPPRIVGVPALVSASGRPASVLQMSPRATTALADDVAELDSPAATFSPRRLLAGVHPWTWPIVIGVVACVVRVWNLDAVGFNSDEVVYSSQAALLAGRSGFSELFPLFRAHPLLFQGLLSLVYRAHMSDLLARLLAVGFGLGTVAAGFWAARTLYGRRVALLAAAILAVTPYAVIVNRQVLLDGPMVFFSTLALGCAARFATTREPVWLHAATVALGLTFLTKETGILLAASMYAFIVLTPRLRVRFRDICISLTTLVAFVAVFPVSVLAGKRAQTGEQFFLWQIVRRPNHALTFYFEHVPQALGLGVVLAAVIGLWVLRNRRTWRETLLLCWIVVPLIFFIFWPVKGYQYLLPITPAVAILAGRALGALPTTGWLDLGARQVPAALVTGVAMAVVAVTLLVPTWQAVQPATATTSAAGAGGTPGGREAGRWIAANVPIGARVLTIGPSMANLVRYFGDREAFGLSVSTNPLHRNPVYEPVANADLQLRRSRIQYVVWDANSAERSPTFSAKLLDLARRYNGNMVHRETVGGRSAVLVFQVRP